MIEFRQPEGVMEEIVEKVRRMVEGAEECERRDFHCTLGQISEEEYEEVAMIWEPFSFQVEAIDLLVLRSGVMKSQTRVFLR